MTRRTGPARVAAIEAKRPRAVTVMGAVQAAPRGLRALARLLEIGIAVDAAQHEGRGSAP